MQELQESEVTEVSVLTGPTFAEGSRIDIEGTLYEVGSNGKITPVTDEFNNPFHDHEAIRKWNNRAWEALSGPRKSDHALGRAPRALVLEKRRARAKKAKASRKRNQRG